jgi:Zn finger protein HypA/HybF involved in hydrogenase expression
MSSQPIKFEEDPFHENMNTEEFIELCELIYKGLYDYSETIYLHPLIKVKVKCPKRGVFEITPRSFLTGRPCYQGSYSRNIKEIDEDEEPRMTTELFKKKAKLVHGDLYNYQYSRYVSEDGEITIKCPKHGVFKQTASMHLRGHKCPKCSTRIIHKTAMNTESFIEQGKLIHGDCYDYSDTIYKLLSSKVIIKCPEHGPFSIKANKFLMGEGCPNCKDE